jgi:uncharacterized protein (DUF983 family)
MRRVSLGFWRAIRLRCPYCGAGPLFVSWFKMVEACPGCGLRLEEREEGYFSGAMVTNYFIAAGWFLVLVLPSILLSPFYPVFNTLLWVAIGFMVASPVLFWRFSKTLWVAFDLSLRPAQPEDFVRPGEPSAPEPQKAA